MDNVVVQPGVYRHFKFGNLYQVFGVVPDASELKPGELPRPPLVFYQQRYAPYAFLYRTLTNFREHVERPDYNYSGPRFTFVE